MAVLRNFREKPLKESEKELAIQKTIDDINKKYGKGALVRGADARGLKIGRLKTGSLSLDVATGGGIAQGKLNEFYGPWCLSGDTEVYCKVPGAKTYLRLENLYYDYDLNEQNIYVKSVDKYGIVYFNRLLAVHDAGRKRVFEVTTTSGLKIKSTLDHMFLSGWGFTKLDYLQYGDMIKIVDYDNVKWDTITCIEPVGEEDTYDLTMQYPDNNFVANNFVVHNSGGKSFVSMLTMAQTQRDYPEANVALIDFEGAFDAEWAKKVGVNVENLLISSPEWMEDGLQIAVDLIHSKDCALIVIDSLGAACPKAEHEGDITDFTVGLRARIGNKFVRKSKGKVDLLSDEIDLGQSTLLVINQEYQGIGPYAGTETPGGVQVKFGAMIRVRIRKGEVVNDPKDGTQLMQESRFIVVKNKTYSPHKAGAFWMSTKDNPKGKAGEIYRVGEVLTQGIISGVIQRSGSWYTLPKEFGLEKSLQGEAAVADWVEENPDKYPRLEELVLDSILRRGDG